MRTLRSVAPACLLVVAAAAAAQDRPAMSIVDMLNVPELSNPRLAPDGSAVVFELAEPDWKQNKRITHLWRQPVGGGDAVQITNGAEGESDARWSPDGGYIAFLAKRGDDEEAQIYLLPTGGGEARLLFTESALLMLPLADQSMPYNVISITGTLVALFSGSMFNLLTRRGGGRPPRTGSRAR